MSVVNPLVDSVLATNMHSHTFSSYNDTYRDRSLRYAIAPNGESYYVSVGNWLSNQRHYRYVYDLATDAAIYTSPGNEAAVGSELEFSIDVTEHGETTGEWVGFKANGVTGDLTIQRGRWDDSGIGGESLATDITYDYDTGSPLGRASRAGKIRRATINGDKVIWYEIGGTIIIATWNGSAFVETQQFINPSGYTFVDFCVHNNTELLLLYTHDTISGRYGIFRTDWTYGNTYIISWFDDFSGNYTGGFAPTKICWDGYGNSGFFLAQGCSSTQPTKIVYHPLASPGARSVWTLNDSGFGNGSLLENINGLEYGPDMYGRLWITDLGDATLSYINLNDKNRYDWCNWIDMEDDATSGAIQWVLAPIFSNDLDKLFFTGYASDPAQEPDAGDVDTYIAHNLYKITRAIAEPPGYGGGDLLSNTSLPTTDIPKYEDDFSVFYELCPPLAKTTCAFRGQLFLGHILGDWYDCSENYVAWSGIGYADFELHTNNEAGYMPMPRGGNVQKLLALRDYVMVYCENATYALRPVGDPAPTYGLIELSNVGIATREAAAGDENQHFFIDQDGALWRVSNGLEMERLGYEEYLRPIIESEDSVPVMLSWDPVRSELWICNDSKAFVFSPNGMFEAYYTSPSLVPIDGVMQGPYTSLNGDDTLQAYLETNILDFGQRVHKRLNFVELGVDQNETCAVKLFYRYDRKESWRESNWKNVNERGQIFFGVSATEFKIAVRSENYDYFNIDYLIVRVQLQDKRTIRGVYNATGEA